MKKNYLTTLIVLIFCSLILFSCSSAPKRNMQVSTIYSSACELIESANSCILRGDYEKAEFLLSNAENQAISIDNFDLMISTSLTKCSLALSKNPVQLDIAKANVNYAKECAPFSSDPEKQKAIISISEARVSIAEQNLNSEIKNTELNKIISNLDQASDILKKEPYYTAQILCVQGDIYKLQQNYLQADKLYSQAAKSFTDNLYLSEIGITWYKAAQARSLAQNKDSALEAMENAIYYDRAAENSMALGTDYYAVGLILLKGNTTQEQIQKANKAFYHSAQIFNSIGQTQLANKSLEAMNE